MSSFNTNGNIGMSMWLPIEIVEKDPNEAGLPVTVATLVGGDHVLEDGRLPTGLVTIIVDSLGGMTSGLAALPDWIVTTNLQLRMAADAHVSDRGAPPLTITADVQRRGRSSVVTRVDVQDADARDLATAWLTCAVLTPDHGAPQWDRPLRLEPRRSDDPIFSSPPAEFLGLRVLAAGAAEVHVAERLRNPWGILHGGVAAALVDTAARTLVHGDPSIAAPADTRVTDLTMQYLSPGRLGPIRATATEVGVRGDDRAVRVEVRDVGADGRLMVLAHAIVRRDARDGRMP